MFSKRIILFIENKIIPTLRRSITSRGEVNGLHLQVHKGDEELEETLEFLEATFVKDEPIIDTFQLEDTCDLMRFLKHFVSKSYVIRLINEDCEITSAAVCGATYPGYSDEVRSFAECSTCDPKSKRLFNFWADVGDSHNLFDCFKVKEVWDITFLASASSPLARGKGLSKIILCEAKLTGKKEGFSICRMDCTSYFTAKLAESMKFVTLPPRNALTYRDKKGCPWLPRKPPHPHGNIVISYDFLC